MTNLLLNPDLIHEAVDDKHRAHFFTTHDPNQDVYVTSAYHQITRPDGWEIWVEHAEEAVHEWDPDNEHGWVVPEVKLTEALFDSDGNVSEKIYPNRWAGDARGLVFFNAFNTSRGGLFQIFDTKLGSSYMCGYSAHGWSSDENGPTVTDCVGSVGFKKPWSQIEAKGIDVDCLKSLGYRIGVDPLGGADPFADSVIWSDHDAIYNVYGRLPVLLVEAQSERMTVFSWAENRWRNLHNDRYMTAFVAEEMDAHEPPHAVPQYDRLCYLVPQNATEEQFVQVARIADKTKSTVTRSADDAGLYALLINNPATTKNVVKVVWFSSSDWDLLEIENFFDIYYPGTIVEHERLYSEPGPPVATGAPCILGCHGNGEGVITEHVEYLSQYGTSPTVKSFGVDDNMRWLEKVKIMDPDVITVGRLSAGIDDTNVEGPGFDDPEGSAERVYNSCISIWLKHPYVDYWEVINEQDEVGPDGHVRIARFFVRLMDLVRPHGIKLALFSYSLGVPEREEWIAINNETDCLRMAAEEGHPLALHEYGYMDVDRPWIIGRFLVIGELFPDLVALGLRVLITEYNIEESSSGVGMTDVPVDVWINEMERYDKLCRECGYVIGIHIFTFGTVASWEDWDPDKIKTPDGTPYSQYWREYVKEELLAGEAPSPIPSWYDEDLTYSLPRRTDYEIMECPLSIDGWWKRELSQIDGLTIHHFGGDWTIEEVANYQVNNGPNGPTPSIHYHVVITEDGKIYKTNNFREGVWHDHTGHQNTHLSVALHGNLAINMPTQAQLESLVKVCWCFIDDSPMNITLDTVVGHMEYTTTVCPGWSSEASGYWKLDFYDMLHGLEHGFYQTGVHGAPITAAPVRGNVVEMMRMDGLHKTAVYYKALYDGNSDKLDLIDALSRNGKEPVVRIYEPGSHLPGRNPRVPLDVPALIGAGVKYIEVMNEPNIEWPGTDWHDQSKVDMLAESWWADARVVMDAGGFAAFPAMAPTDRGAVNDTVSGVMWAWSIYEWMYNYHHNEVQGYLLSNQLWLAAHVSPFNKPFTYDPRGGLNYVDDFCILYYEVIQDWFKTDFGITPITISTEGGVYSPSHMRDLTFPVVDGWVVSDSGERLYNDDTWGDYVWMLDDFLRARGTISSVCSWTFSDEGVADQRWLGCGWYDAQGNARSPAQQEI